MVLALASFAPASVIVTVNVLYLKSWNADYSDSAVLSEDLTPNGTGGTLKTIELPAGNTFVNHQFEYFVTVSGLAAGQNVVDLAFNRAVTGATTVASGDWSLNNPTIDPPAMGSPSSNAPSAAALTDLSVFSGTAWGFDVRRGPDTGGTKGNDFGDYAAFYNFGAANTDLGTQNVVDATDAGTLAFTFKNSASTFKIISGNTNGAALNVAAESYMTNATWTANSDSIAFAPTTTPEPSTLALLGCGLFGLLAYAWRKRK
jgi:hypothetical protein